MVDDDPADALLVRRAFDKLNASIMMEHMSDGARALARLRRSDLRRPDLILLDLNMPGISGLEFLKTLRADPVLLALPVVVLSTSNDPKDIHDAYLEYANSYVQKPTDLSTFTKIVQDIGHFWSDVALIP
ncbi:MAG: response regulator [Myxococcota bacterium]